MKLPWLKAAAVDEGQEIAFLADVEIQAAADMGGGNPRPATFSMNAYTGGRMKLAGYSNEVVIDLAGARAHRTDTTVLYDHDPDKLVGQGKAKITSAGIAFDGTITGEDQSAQSVVKHARNGFKWQASIGGRDVRHENVRAGDKAQVNGRTETGPLTIVREFVLGESSFVHTGADKDSSASVKARNAKMGQLNSGLSEGQEGAVLGERKRISQIRAICGDKHPAIAARAVDEGWDAEQAELHVLRAEAHNGGFRAELDTLRASRGKTTGGAPSNSIVATDARLEQQALVASMLMSSGLSQETVAKLHEGEHQQRVMNLATSRQFRGAGIQAAFRAVLKAAGRFEELANHRFNDDTIRAAFESSQMIRAGGDFSTLDLSGILGDFLHKYLEAGYQAAEPTWQFYCKIRPLEDFKPQHIFRMIGMGDFQQVGADGELHHITLDEESYLLQASTFGAMLGITRQMIINDDLSAFGDVAFALARMGVIKLEEVVYTLLLSNANSFFSEDNGNYISGGASALALSSLGTAEKQFLLQTDDNGKPILVSPKTLLVGPTNAVAARQLVGSTDLLQTALQSASGVGLANQQPSGNPFVRQLALAVSPWLENEAIAGNSTTQWFLFADPNRIAPFYVGFLNGQNKPTVQTGEADFDTLGMVFRSFFDFGVSQGNYRTAFQSAGQ